MNERGPVGKRRRLALCTRPSPIRKWIGDGRPSHAAEGIYQLADKIHLDVQKCVSAAAKSSK
jgi:hypothetical protein